MPSRNREIILGVGGGISAYKSADLLRRLQDCGYLVTVIPTRASQNFIGNATWAALSGREVHDDLWSNVHSVPHVNMAKKAAAIIVAPATADLISRIATGRADDLLTNVILASTSRMIVVPAMHPEMWLNDATQENVSTLRRRGITVVEPDEGRMTGNDFGVGRYPETPKILSALENLLKVRHDLVGIEILITAGGTREAIDPVRFIGNNSSGKQGFALAEAAASRGARVTLIEANTQCATIEGITTVSVKNADEMHKEVSSRFARMDVVIMSAAVADAKPLHQQSEKLDKESYSSIDLEPTVDILRELGERKEKQILIGFAAQTGIDGPTKAIAKYASKNLDYLYFNDVSGGAIFGSEHTSGSIIGDGVVIETISNQPKMTLAHRLLDLAGSKLGLPHD